MSFLRNLLLRTEYPAQTEEKLTLAEISGVTATPVEKEQGEMAELFSVAYPTQGYGAHHDPVTGAAIGQEQ